MNKEPKMYLIHISLLESEPLIWRSIIVRPDINLYSFHKIIQTTMGWSNLHLHAFEYGEESYAPKEQEVDDTKDSRKVKLNSLLKKEGDFIIYEYDFGDSWVHEIKLENILPFDEALKLPVCVDGELSCPPEDCGGIWAYEDMKVILANPKHKEYKQLMEWLDEDFNPQFFDLAWVNKSLHTRNFGCFNPW